jgi:hypothetical protein
MHESEGVMYGEKGLGFKESYLKEKFTTDEWASFLSFMYGQTAAIDDETVYYYGDVQRFCQRYGVKYPVDNQEKRND